MPRHRGVEGAGRVRPAGETDREAEAGREGAEGPAGDARSARGSARATGETREAEATLTELWSRVPFYEKPDWEKLLDQRQRRGVPQRAAGLVRAGIKRSSGPGPDRALSRRPPPWTGRRTRQARTGLGPDPRLRASTGTVGGRLADRRRLGRSGPGRRRHRQAALAAALEAAALLARTRRRCRRRGRAGVRGGVLDRGRPTCLAATGAVRTAGPLGDHRRPTAGAPFPLAIRRLRRGRAGTRRCGLVIGRHESTRVPCCLCGPDRRTRESTPRNPASRGSMSERLPSFAEESRPRTPIVREGISDPV